MKNFREKMCKKNKIDYDLVNSLSGTTHGELKLTEIILIN